jgi:amidohydrolase family protein
MAIASKWMTAFAVVVVLGGGISMRGQDQTLVIEGGTLIDGTGRNPVKNAVVVIEGNRFKAVGVKGKVPYPKTAKVIKADGKTILPGLIDTQAQGNWFYEPPQWIYFGITTVYFNGSPYMRQQRDLQERGQLKSPRIFLTAGSIDAAPELLRADRRASARLWPEGWSVRTPQEAVAAVEKRFASDSRAKGIVVFEGITPELLRAISDQSHKHGLSVGGRSEFVTMTAENGQDATYHMAGVIRATITKPDSVAKLKKLKEEHWELYWPIADGNYAYMMEPETFDGVIKKMVDHHMYLAPTISHTVWGWGTQIPHAKEWSAEIMEFAKTPGLDFVPQNVRNLWLNADKTTERVKGRFVVGDQVDATHPTDMEGYAKRDQFLQKFVKAGGKIMGGADNSFDVVTGLTTHQELQQLVYCGLTPMQAILSVTKWAAESWHNEKDLGTIEPGKLADLITVNGDPLANIKNTRNVDLVIQDGKVLDRAFDPNWKNPIMPPKGEYVGRDTGAKKD